MLITHKLSSNNTPPLEQTYHVYGTYIIMLFSHELLGCVSKIVFHLIEVSTIFVHKLSKLW